MQPKGFADSFFSPDYAAGLGVLFQKLNQVPISHGLVDPALIKRAASKMKNYYPSRKPVQTQKKHMEYDYKNSPKMQLEREASLATTAPVPVKPLTECEKKWKRSQPPMSV